MSYTFKTIEDLSVANNTVIVRANLDVPIKNGEVIDDSRLRASLPTYEYLLKRDCKIVIIGHLGRPDGEYKDELSLLPVRFALGRLLSKTIKFANIDACANSIKFMDAGEITMIENLRFDPREESDDKKQREEYITELAELADAYINDCFGLYRIHASVKELAQALPSAAGKSIEAEVKKLSKLRDEYKSPYIVVFGGAKLEEKTPMIEHFIGKADTILIGGAMAYNFLVAEGVEVGDSKTDSESIKMAKQILKKARASETEIILPVDHIVASEFDESSKAEEVSTQAIPKGKIGMDIGPKTIVMFREIIEGAKTVLWNGPMGVFEWEQFNKGTESIGEFIALSTPKDAFKVAGGGDTLAAMEILKIKPKRFDHVSVGGGMMLKFLAGEEFEVLELLTK